MFESDAATLGSDVANLLSADRKLEAATINLIASASYCPAGLREIEGSHLVNRAPMGLPRRRTVANCEMLDAIEELAITRAKALFGAEHVNVQPLSSTIANVAVLRAVLPRDGARLLAFDELSGGHVSHGTARHITGDHRHVVHFGVDADGRPDLDKARHLAKRERPHAVIAGPSTYPREMDFAALRSIADEVGALLITDIAHTAGLIATGLHANPVPISDLATTSTQKTLCGPRNGGFVFCDGVHADAVDTSVYPGLQGPAAANLIAARAVQLELVTRPAFKTLMQAVVHHASVFAKTLLEEGVSLYTGGTDSHLVVAYAGERWDAPSLTACFGRSGITLNAIRAPASDGSPRAAIRVGTVAMSIRGVSPETFRRIAVHIAGILRAGPNATTAQAKTELTAIAAAHPIPSFTV
jgi:glycine hydroxymethyltransferase